jgi:hypothetical protein
MKCIYRAQLAAKEELIETLTSKIKSLKEKENKVL